MLGEAEGGWECENGVKITEYRRRRLSAPPSHSLQPQVLLLRNPLLSPGNSSFSLSSIFLSSLWFFFFFFFFLRFLFVLVKAFLLRRLCSILFGYWVKGLCFRFSFVFCYFLASVFLGIQTCIFFAVPHLVFHSEDAKQSSSNQIDSKKKKIFTHKSRKK